MKRFRWLMLGSSGRLRHSSPLGFQENKLLIVVFDQAYQRFFQRSELLLLWRRKQRKTKWEVLLKHPK
jgi:hypothetical protein